MEAFAHDLKLAYSMSFIQKEDYITMLAMIGDLYNLQKELHLHNRTACAAALGGHLHVLTWLYQHNISMDLVMEAAAGRDHLEILEWGLKHNLKLNPECMWAAIEHGSIETMQWLWDHGVELNCKCYIKVGANLEKAEWLYQHKCVCSKKEFYALLDFYVDNNNLTMIKWLHNKGLQMKYLIELACGVNNEEILEWAIKEAFSINAEQINMVGEVCSFNIFKDMILHGAPIEEVQPEVPMRFAYEGNLEALEWLKDNQVDMSNVLIGALRGKQWSSIKWALDNLSVDEAQVMPNAIRHTSVEIANWLHQMNYPLSKECYNKLHSSSIKDRIQKMHWLREHNCPR